MSLFPYSYREGQKEAIDEITKVAGKRPIIFQAPTGFGKTPVVLSSLLLKGFKILWAVRTGTETDRPVEELKKINEVFGTEFLGISFRGKKDMCLLALEKMSDANYDEVSYFCSKNRKRCPYYINLQNERFTDVKTMLYSEVLRQSAERRICPYFYQRELAGQANLVSVSYNYVLNEKVSWSLRSAFDYGDSYLVVDEAHNLQFSFMNINSDHITTGSIKRALSELSFFKKTEQVKNFLVKLEEKMWEELGKKKEKEVKIEDFCSSKNSDVLDEIKLLGETLRSERLSKGERPQSSLYHIYSFFKISLELSKEKGVTHFLSKEKNELKLERVDMRASEALKEKWKMFRGVLFMSGTLEPIEAFSEVIGIHNPYIINRKFKVSSENVSSIIIKGVTTKGERLSEEMLKRYMRVILSFLRKNSGRNVAVFSSSYRIQEALLSALPEDFRKRSYLEVEGMSGQQSREVLNSFKLAAKSNQKGILFASASGRFSEGADFPGEELEAAMVIGIPFEKLNIKIKALIRYYNEIYGRKKGRYYAYTVPALRKVSQALGRVIRSENDKGYFVLADERFLYKKYFDLLPEFIKRNYSIIDYESL